LTRLEHEGVSLGAMAKLLMAKTQA
jgi:hypothetical protein